MNAEAFFNRGGVDEPVYNHLQVEAGLCVWEHMLTQQGDSTLRAIWQDNGTVTMRHAAIRIGVWVEEVYRQVPAEEWDLWVYDWEIVPAIFAQVQWEGPGFDNIAGLYYTLPDPKVAATAALDALKAQEDRLKG